MKRYMLLIIIILKNITSLNATLSFASSLAGSATAGSTSFGTGFYGSAFESFEGTETSTTSTSITNTSSNIISNNGDINIISNNKDITQKGSLVYTDNGDINYNAENDINIIASKDIYNQSTKSKNISESISVGNNAIQVGFNSGKSTSSTNSIRNNNSIINTNNGNITLITNDNDINIKGANIEANNIDIDVANNLNIESLQDTYYSKSNSNNSGFNIGAGSGSANIGFNITNTKGTTDSQWVNDQTSIIGNNKVDIKVGTKENSEGNTNIKGAVIASGKYKTDINGNVIFEDNNNLDINTNTLTYSDINDFYKQNTKGHNFNTSIGSDKTDNKQLNLHPQGSTTIGLINQSEEKEQITRATVGGGSITIGGQTQSEDSSLLAGLNRDINNSQETTKDMITGAANNTIELDNRVFTPSGRKSIYSDVRNAPGNLINTTAGAMSEAEEISEFGRETLKKVPGVGLVVSQPFSAVEGFFDYFVENDSKAYVYDERKGLIETSDIKKSQNYYVNGINNKEEDIQDFLNKNQSYVVRYNPTSGALGDVIESGLGKLFNWNGITAKLGSMNRIVANDLTIRKDNQNSENKFHSQGTIIGTGGMSITNRNNIKLDNSQTMRAVGPAVYETTWNKKADQTGAQKKYDHDELDGVRKITSPRTLWDPFVGIYNMITTPEKHNISNYR